MYYNIPKEYKEFWTPFRSRGVLHHITTRENYTSILRDGMVLPCDPAPKQWAGLSAVFLSDPDHSFYEIAYLHTLTHVLQKHPRIVQLYIKTNNFLWHSYGPGAIRQVVSLSPIPMKDIVFVEELS